MGGTNIMQVTYTYRETSKMTERPTVLVPIKVLEGESIPDGIPDLLSGAHVFLLGYHIVPEQTATGQAQMQFEERASNRLDKFQELFETAGATVEHRLVFTHEGQKTIDRMIYEHECEAVLVPSATADVSDVLVAVRGTVGIDRIARVVAALFAGRDIGITLVHILQHDETDDDAKLLLEGFTTNLEDLGVDPAKIEYRVLHDDKPIDALVDAAESYDAIIMGESDPSLVTFVFGLRAEQVAERFLGPVLIVQRERAELSD